MDLVFKNKYTYAKLSKKGHETRVLFFKTTGNIQKVMTTDFSFLFGNMAKSYNDNIASG